MPEPSEADPFCQLYYCRLFLQISIFERKWLCHIEMHHSTRYSTGLRVGVFAQSAAVATPQKINRQTDDEPDKETDPGFKRQADHED